MLSLIWYSACLRLSELKALFASGVKISLVLSASMIAWRQCAIFSAPLEVKQYWVPLK